MSFPSYVRKARQGFQLQRAVPKDCQVFIGKKVWVETGIKTLNEARARVPSFVTRTDELIATARGQSNLTTDELMEQLPALTPEEDREDMQVALQMLSLSGVDAISKEQAARGSELLQGVAKPSPLFTADDLINARIKTEDPAPRTVVGWRKELRLFMDFSRCVSPLSCTEKQAVAYKDQLLTQVSPATAKVRLAYLAGLWTTLVTVHKDKNPTHIFKGIPASIKMPKGQRGGVKRMKTFITKPIEEWEENKYLDVFKAWYYTGCRNMEICRLHGEHILDDRIFVEWYEDERLKTEASHRYVPIHPKLEPILAKYRGRKGLLWPSLETTTIEEGVEVVRYGHNLSKPCKKVTGLRPKDLRDRFADQLRTNDVTERVIGVLMGHSASDTTGTYGGQIWDKLVRSVGLIV